MVTPVNDLRQYNLRGRRNLLQRGAEFVDFGGSSGLPGETHAVEAVHHLQPGRAKWRGKTLRQRAREFPRGSRGRTRTTHFSPATVEYGHQLGHFRIDSH